MIRQALSAALLASVIAQPVTAQSDFMLPDLDERPENPDCPNAPSRPESIEGMTARALADELYQQQGYRNVVEAGECTCAIRFPSWDRVTEALETDFAGISRFEYLEIISDIQSTTKAYRREGRPICRDAGLW
ncbi:MAG: hypothetical protein HWE26_22380 [Alteromonadaceae bacterium]|nr:hypothetical protein [Alteromonadaceae bacterium]